MPARGLAPGPTTQRSAEHQGETHWPVIAVSLKLTLARDGMVYQSLIL
jgi:hypothetical protein